MRHRQYPTGNRKRRSSRSAGLASGLSRLASLAGLGYLLASLYINRDALTHTWVLKRLTPHLATAAIFVPAYLLLLRKRLHFWNNFIHEVTHLAAAVVSLCRVRSVQAAETGGVLSVDGKSTWLVRLAPFCIPLLPLTLYALSLFIRHEYQQVLRHAVWITYLWFQLTVFQYFSFSKTDVTESGRLFSLVFVLMANTLTGAAMLTYLNGDAGAILRIVKTAS